MLKSNRVIHMLWKIELYFEKRPYSAKIFGKDCKAIQIPADMKSAWRWGELSYILINFNYLLYKLCRQRVLLRQEIHSWLKTASLCISTQYHKLWYAGIYLPEATLFKNFIPLPGGNTIVELLQWRYTPIEVTFVLAYTINFIGLLV